MRLRCRACVVGVDVQVSVQTNLLHAWPTLLMQSQLPCSTILPLTTAASVSSLASDGETRASARCWLCRFGSVGTTYAEMVHPADVEREEISHATDVAKISRELFGHSLEKGSDPEGPRPRHLHANRWRRGDRFDQRTMSFSRRRLL